VTSQQRNVKRFFAEQQRKSVERWLGRPDAMIDCRGVMYVTNLSCQLSVCK